MSIANRAYRTALALAAIVMALVTIGYSQEPAIEVAASLDKPTVVLGEPVVLYVLLTNRSAAALSISAQLDPEYRRIRYFVSRGTDPEREFMPWAILENDLETPLAPGASRSVPGKIFFGARGWSFPAPGVYQVRAMFRGVSSTPVSLTVTTSDNPVEQKLASALIETPEAGLFLLVDGGDDSGKGAALVRQIAASETRLSGYANHSMGVSLSQPFVNLRTNAVRATDLGAAERFLTRSKALLPRDALYYKLESESLRIDVTRSLGKAGDAVQMQQAYDQLLRDNLLAKPLPEATRVFLQGTIKK